MDDEDELEIYANPNHHLDVADSTKAITLVSFGYKHGAPGDTIHNFNIQQKVITINTKGVLIAFILGS